ncbi:MAG: phosphoglycerate kinase, partial [Bdellovibrionales bacterium]|nr:phosphoglycerate kinase [Bdellovibrionales bacterium]
AYSLMPVGERLASFLKEDVIVPDDCVGSGVEKLMKDQEQNQIILLENLRFHIEEEKNDPKFALRLKSVTDVFVNDAFGAMHRAHASTDALPRLYQQKAIGRLVEKELQFLSRLTEKPERPYAVILGGAKVSDKLKVIENLVRKVDRIFLGGAMVFTFLKALGFRVGDSLVENSMLIQVERAMDAARKKDVDIIFPSDFALGKSVENPGECHFTKDKNIPEGFMGLDVGPKTIEDFCKRLEDCQTVFWNGPLGLFEKAPYDQGTVAIAKFLGELSCTKVLGGGDSAAAAAKAGVTELMTHVSTGGGATLEFLEGRTLPGLQALAV